MCLALNQLEKSSSARPLGLLLHCLIKHVALIHMPKGMRVGQHLPLESITMTPKLQGW